MWGLWGVDVEAAANYCLTATAPSHASSKSSCQTSASSRIQDRSRNLWMKAIRVLGRMDGWMEGGWISKWGWWMSDALNWFYWWFLLKWRPFQLVQVRPSSSLTSRHSRDPFCHGDPHDTVLPIPPPPHLFFSSDGYKHGLQINTRPSIGFPSVSASCNISIRTCTPAHVRWGRGGAE